MSEPQVAVWWLPVAGDGQVAKHFSRWWEAIRARLAHRAPQPLFHAALEVSVDQTRYVIEMAPAWARDSGDVRGVAVCGPVGLEWLGRWRLFRYELRCWPNGTLPDKSLAPEPPTVRLLTHAEAIALVERTATVPRHTWGRDVYGIGDMWNSNSVVSWLLETGGIDAMSFIPPNGGSAPGWRAGIAAAQSENVQ